MQENKKYYQFHPIPILLMDLQFQMEIIDHRLKTPGRGE